MKLSANNFLTIIKEIVTGGGRRADGSPYNDAGFLKRAEGVSLSTMLATASLGTLTDNTGGTASATAIANLADGTTYANDHAAIENNFATLTAKYNALINFISGTADETNAKVVKVEEAVDTVGTIRWTVPLDYDENTDSLKVRVLASQLTSSTDNDVELDAQVYVKTAGSALGADLNPTAPGTVLSTTEQWIEFDLDGNSLDRDDVVFFTLITNGANDTDGEEVLIHDVEFRYRSTLVSYDSADASGNRIR